ncbi:MAG: hypothetical protein QXP96_06625 [Thermoproteota archaeon]
MPLEAKGKFGKAKKGATGAIWVPAALVRDSQFPLKEGRVLIKIEKDTLIVKQARE